MFDLGDELLTKSYSIQWLVWIQLLVMVLLIILLYLFTTSALDLSGGSTAAPPPSTACRIPRIHNPPLLITACLHNSKVIEDQSIKETTRSTSRGIARSKEDIQESEGPSTKDATHVPLSGRPLHPCRFLGIATQAILKCLGLDSTSDFSSNIKQRKKH